MNRTWIAQLADALPEKSHLPISDLDVLTRQLRHN
jgi:hypothetical protein